MTKKLDLEELIRLEQAADVGPWLYSEEREQVDTGQLGNDGCVYDMDSYDVRPANGRFIVALRNAAKELISYAKSVESGKSLGE